MQSYRRFAGCSMEKTERVHGDSLAFSLVVHQIQQAVSLAMSVLEQNYRDVWARPGPIPVIRAKSRGTDGRRRTDGDGRPDAMGVVVLALNSEEPDARTAGWTGACTSPLIRRCADAARPSSPGYSKCWTTQFYWP